MSIVNCIINKNGLYSKIKKRPPHRVKLLIHKAYILCISETIGLFNMVRFLTVAPQDLVDNPLDYIEVKNILVRTFGKIENISEFKNSAGKGQLYKVHKITLDVNQHKATTLHLQYVAELLKESERLKLAFSLYLR